MAELDRETFVNSGATQRQEVRVAGRRRSRRSAAGRAGDAFNSFHAFVPVCSIPAHRHTTAYTTLLRRGRWWRAWTSST